MAYLGNSPANALFNLSPPVTLAGGQTVVNINYTPGRTLFLLNGAVQTLNDDITATNGSTATLATAARAGDQLVAINFASFSVANALPLSGGALAGPTSGVTPAQFDSSTLLATTAFVKAAQGNFSGFLQTTGATTLQNAQTGFFVELAGAGSYTVTLPPPTSLMRFTFYNANASTVTLSTPSGQIFNSLSGSAALAVPTAGSFELVCDGTSWIVVSGMGSASLTGSGWQKLPSGLIVQWGQTGISNGTSDNTTTLPLTFPTAFIQVTVTQAYTAGSGSIGYAAASGLANRSQFTWRGSIAGNGFQFIAIGW